MEKRFFVAVIPIPRSRKRNFALKTKGGREALADVRLASDWTPSQCPCLERQNCGQQRLPRRKLGRVVVATQRLLCRRSPFTSTPNAGSARCASNSLNRRPERVSLEPVPFLTLPIFSLQLVTVPIVRGCVNSYLSPIDRPARGPQMLRLPTNSTLVRHSNAKVASGRFDVSHRRS